MLHLLDEKRIKEQAGLYKLLSSTLYSYGELKYLEPDYYKDKSESEFFNIWAKIYFTKPITNRVSDYLCEMCLYAISVYGRDESFLMTDLYEKTAEKFEVAPSTVQTSVRKFLLENSIVEMPIYMLFNNLLESFYLDYLLFYKGYAEV